MLQCVPRSVPILSASKPSASCSTLTLRAAWSSEEHAPVPRRAAPSVHRRVAPRRSPGAAPSQASPLRGSSFMRPQNSAGIRPRAIPPSPCASPEAARGCSTRDLNGSCRCPRRPREGQGGPMKTPPSTAARSPGAAGRVPRLCALVILICGATGSSTRLRRCPLGAAPPPLREHLLLSARETISVPRSSPRG